MNASMISRLRVSRILRLQRLAPVVRRCAEAGAALPFLAVSLAAQVPAPAGLPGHGPALPRDSMRVDGLERSFRYFSPAGLPPAAPLVLVFHGSGGNGARIRGFIGRPLEKLATERGFVVAYPDGFGGNWNDCRARAPFPANTRDIADPEFVDALIRWFREHHGIDTSRVYAIGFSNGGHFAFRLALELPDRVLAVAAFGASLPVAAEMECTPGTHMAAIMIANGTADPVNPYLGGDVTAPGGSHLGRVRSAARSAQHLAELFPVADAPRTERLSEAAERDGTWIERTEWGPADAPRVVLYSIHGGGHTIPGPMTALPDLLGPTDRRFDGLRAAIDFFESVSTRVRRH